MNIFEFGLLHLNVIVIQWPQSVNKTIKYFDLCMQRKCSHKHVTEM